MERLPDEILDVIAGFLPQRGLAPYATLSTRWQRAIERRTFSRLRIQSTDEEFESLGRFVKPCRFKYLRQLYFTIVVPFHETRIKKNEQQARFSAAFTDAMRKLFQVLASIESSAGNATITGAKKSGIFLFIREINSALDTWDQQNKFLTRHIGLAEYESFPLVQSISHLGMRDPGRKLALRAGIELSTRLPNLRELDLETIEQESGRFVSHSVAIRENRRGFAEALAKADFLAGQNLRQFTLTTDDLEATDLLFKPRFVFPNCHASTTEPSYDPLSAAIRTLSHNLVSLNLCGTFNSSLFWPTESEPNGSSTSASSPLSAQWPHLKYTTVKLGLCTPNGGWHFKAKPGARARRGSWPPPLNVPSEDEMQCLFASWSKALSQMPVLESATIWFHVEMMIEEPRERYVDKWVIGFQAPGQVPDPLIFTSHNAKVTMEELQNPRLVFERTNGWRPWKTTMDSLHKIAKDRFPGKDLVKIDVDMMNKVTRR
ncbi:hypothetical protein G7054_g512 [Neopestalotiopsis clavispora]|nr:hypothetical protein G7054_g512 [Neopestalotiopsis clavispora]